MQVYQLMMPHYHYTMQINAQARAALINVGGIVERVRHCRCCSQALGCSAQRDAARSSLHLHCYLFSRCLTADSPQHLLRSGSASK